MCVVALALAWLYMRLQIILERFNTAVHLVSVMFVSLHAPQMYLVHSCIITSV